MRGGPLPLLSEVMQKRVARRSRNPEARRAAVMVPIAVIDGVPSVVLSVRSDVVSTHRNEVGFPGGHLESGETYCEAAYREAEEELGLKFREGFCTVDTCEEILSPSGTVVRPVVTTRTQSLDLVRDVTASEEVATVFALSVAHLLDPANKEYRDYGDERGRLPVIHGGPMEIWGFTAFILDACLENIVRPCWETNLENIVKPCWETHKEPPP